MGQAQHRASAEDSDKPPLAAEDAAAFEKFVHLLSHDVRACARALTVLPEWIEEDLGKASYPIGPAVAEHICMMKIHARRLDQMLLDLLCYSRAGKRQDLVRIDASRIVNDVLQRLAPPDRYRITQDIGPEQFEFNESDAGTLFHALISNALKHSGPDARAIHISVRHKDGICRICVEDDGPGIPADQREKVLEPMALLHPRDVTEGSGMGLAIVQKIARACGGDVAWRVRSGSDIADLEVYFPVTNRQPAPAKA